MRQNDILIKWTGSKRLQSPHIIKFFPKKIKTYREPFIGGGSMLYVLLSSDIEVENFECSDLNGPLIAIWQLVKDNPEELFNFYKDRWPFENDQYYKMRGEFNKDQDPKKFFCILRACRNGLVRYNQKGEFTSAFHLGRKGITPDKLHPVIMDWSSKLQRVAFKSQDYQEVESEEDDFIYLDPPYAFIGEFYHGMIDFQKLWDWMGRQKAAYALSLNGMKGDKDCTVDVPSGLFDEHMLVDNGNNKFDQLNGNSVKAKDSLYVKVPESLYEQHVEVPGGFHRFNRIDRTEINDSLFLKVGA